MFEIFAIVLSGVIFAQAAPGPNLLAVAGAALGQGRSSALFVTLGVASAIFMWVALNSLGLGTVLAVFPSLITVMKIIGGGYLLFLASKGLRAAFSGNGPAIKADETAFLPLRSFRRGFLVNMTNPKSGLMWAAVVTFMYGAGLSAAEVLVFAPVGAVTALLIYGTYSFLFSTGLARRAYAQFARWFELAFATAFGALGGKLLFDGLREIRE